MLNNHTTGHDSALATCYCLMCCVVSRSIVELHGGTISVQSDGIGRGCVFAVELPISLQRHEISVNLLGGGRVGPASEKASQSNNPLTVIIPKDFSSRSGRYSSVPNFVPNGSGSPSTRPANSNSHRISPSDIPLSSSLSFLDQSDDSKIIADFDFAHGQQQGYVRIPISKPIIASRSMPQMASIKYALNKKTMSTMQAAQNIIFTNRSVLVVDDAPLNRKMLIRLLFGKFKSIREAVDGRDAVNKVKDILARCEPLDVILMDFVMPQLNGPDAVREIRNMGYTGVVIGVTGNAQQEDIDVFLYHGSDRVISKPVDVVALLKIIDGT